MSTLPTGTVTFLFTDIEGSTRLLRGLGERYAEVLADYGRIVRSDAGTHGGREIDTQGDSFFFAFTRAKDAVRAAVAIQLALGAHEWPGPSGPRIRMGLHTGEPRVGGERYIGLGVHRAARIGAVAHGGQVLLSNAKRELLEDDTPDGISTRDLGSYRLKDFERPERLFELIAPGLEETSRPFHPPPASRGPSDPAQLARTAPVALRRGRAVGCGHRSRGVDCLGAGVGGSISIQPNSIIRIDPDTNQVEDAIPVGRLPTGLLVTANAIWVANEEDRTLTRIDKASGDASVIGGIAGATSLAQDERGNVYVSSFDHPYVWRIDPVQLRVAERYRVRSRAVDLAIGGGFIWVLDRFVNAVARIDLAGRQPTTAVAVGSEPIDATFGYGALWVANLGDGSISVLRLGLNRAETIQLNLNDRVFAIAAGEGAVWVAGNVTSTLTRIDPDTRKTEKSISTSPSWGGLGTVTVGAGAVWAANWAAKEIVRIDPDTNTVIARIELPVEPRQNAVEGDEIWVSVVAPGTE